MLQRRIVMPHRSMLQRRKWMPQRRKRARCGAAFIGLSLHFAEFQPMRQKRRPM